MNLATGELLEKDPGKFNQAQALKDPQQSMAWMPVRIRLV